MEDVAVPFRGLPFPARPPLPDAGPRGSKALIGGVIDG